MCRGASKPVCCNERESRSLAMKIRVCEGSADGIGSDQLVNLHRLMY